MGVLDRAKPARVSSDVERPRRFTSRWRVPQESWAQRCPVAGHGILRQAQYSVKGELSGFVASTEDEILRLRTQNDKLLSRSRLKAPPRRTTQDHTFRRALSFTLAVAESASPWASAQGERFGVRVPCRRHHTTSSVSPLPVRGRGDEGEGSPAHLKSCHA